MGDAAALPHDAATAAAGQAYFEALTAGWEEAARRADVRSHDVSLGGATVRLRFAGPDLEPAYFPALGRPLHEPGGGGPEATVLLWDSASSGVEAPAPPWRRADVDGRSREVHAYASGGLKALHDPDSGLVTMYSVPRRLAVVWVPSDEAVPWHERTAPLRPLLHWALTRPGRLLVHGGAVAGDRGAVLIVGPSGSGKSTTALSCVADGWGYLGDDYVVLAGGMLPVVHALYATAKLTPDSPVRGRFAGHVVPPRPDADKVVLDLDSHRRLSAPLRAVVVPRVANLERGSLASTSPTEALRALAPSTILQHPHEAATGLATMAQLVRSVPAYRLDLAMDVTNAPTVLRPLAFA
jgi:hypothetical protein